MFLRAKSSVDRHRLLQHARSMRTSDPCHCGTHRRNAERADWSRVDRFGHSTGGLRLYHQRCSEHAAHTGGRADPAVADCAPTLVLRGSDRVTRGSDVDDSTSWSCWPVRPEGVEIVAKQSAFAQVGITSNSAAYATSEVGQHVINVAYSRVWSASWKPDQTVLVRAGCSDAHREPVEHPALMLGTETRAVR